MNPLGHQPPNVGFLSVPQAFWEPPAFFTFWETPVYHLCFLGWVCRPQGEAISSWFQQPPVPQGHLCPQSMYVLKLTHTVTRFCSELNL